MSVETIIEERLSLLRGGLSLSGLLAYPSWGQPARAVLLCSPHPHFAGDLDNNVIQALAENLAIDSVTLRFNYHGVGNSQIKLPKNVSVFDYWQELEEKRHYAEPLEDIAAAAKALAEMSERLPLAVVGYSFGSVIGLQYGQENPDVELMVGVSPPLKRVDLSFLAKCDKPCLLLIGEEDFLYSQEHIDKLEVSVGPQVQLCVYEEADHFFRGQEEQLAAKVRDFLDAELAW